MDNKRHFKRGTISKLVVDSVFHWEFPITYIPFASLNFRADIIDQWGEFTVKNTTWFLHILSSNLLFFYQKISVFIVFISFFDKVSNLPEFPQQNITQSETGIGDKILSVEHCLGLFQYFGKMHVIRNKK